MNNNSVLEKALVGLFVGGILTAIVLLWRYSERLKIKLLMKWTNKPDHSNLDIDIALRFGIFCAIFVPLLIIVFIVSGYID